MLITWVPVGQVTWAKNSSRRKWNPPSVNSR